MTHPPNCRCFRCLPVAATRTPRDQRRLDHLTLFPVGSTLDWRASQR
jgi:hypothetical protein